MLKGFRNSWWVHLPGIIAIAAMVAAMMMRRPWPSRAPVHFDFRFATDRWGSPREAIVFPFLAATSLMAGMLMSAIWSRREEGRKRFNLVLPLVTLPVGTVAGLHLWYWWNLPTLARTGTAPAAWVWLGISGAIIVTCCLLLESFRKAIPD